MPRVLSVFICIALFPVIGFSSTVSNWTGTTDSQWSLPGNWDNGIPTTGYSAFIQNAANNPVSVTANVAVDGLTIGASSSLSLQSGSFLQTYALTNSGTIRVADNSNIFFVSQGNTSIEDTGVIALNSSGGQSALVLLGTGTVTLWGGSLTMSDSPNNLISTSGVDLLNLISIKGSGQIFVPGNFTNWGTVTASGTAGLTIRGSSSFLNQGNLSAIGGDPLNLSGVSMRNQGLIQANGSPVNVIDYSYVVGGPLNVINHGTMSFTRATVQQAGLIIDATSSATLGAQSNFVAGLIEDHGTLTLAGATVSNTAVINSGTILTSAGPSSQLGGTITNTGTIQISSGSTLSVTGLTNFAGQTLTGGSYGVSGLLVLAGADIATNAANLTLDGAGHIQDTGGLDGLRNFATNTGTFTAQNGAVLPSLPAFTNSGTMVIGPSTTVTAAAYTQTGGSTVINGVLNAPVTLQGGSLSGAGTITGTLVNAGLVSPGNSPGVLHIGGDYVQDSSGVLNMELGSGAFDQLIIAGSAKLGGTLDIVFLPGFQAVNGQIFNIVEYASYSGAFSNVDLGNPYSTLIYTPTGVEFEYRTPEPATWLLLAGGLAWILRRRVRELKADR